MLAYAAHRRPSRAPRPATLLVIAGVHVAALTALALAKSEIIAPPEIVRTWLRNIPIDPPPPPPKPLEQPRPAPPRSTLDAPRPPIDLPPLPGPSADPNPARPSGDPLAGTNLLPLPNPLPQPLPKPQPEAARPPLLTTSGDQLRPLYPEAKRRLSEEATLRLRLAIDDRGRVVAVDPVGRADPAFLAAARSHLLRHWRYRPASEGGRAVAAGVTVTLSFRLSDED